MKNKITGDLTDPKAYREYFLTEFKKRFSQLNYKEEPDQDGKDEELILTIESPSEDIGSLQVFMNRYEITINIPKISFHSHFALHNSIHHLAPDADSTIPPRLSALDFINNFVEGKLFIRGYKRKGEIEYTKVVDNSSGFRESASTFTFPFIRMFLKYDKVDYYWSGENNDINSPYNRVKDGN